MSMIWMTGKCPHCEVRKHQAGTEEYAAQVLNAAFKRHIAEAHPEEAAMVESSESPAVGRG